MSVLSLAMPRDANPAARYHASPLFSPRAGWGPGAPAQRSRSDRAAAAVPLLSYPLLSSHLAPHRLGITVGRLFHWTRGFARSRAACWLLALWFTGAAIQIPVLLWQWRQSRQLRRTARPTACEPLLAAMDDLCRRLNLESAPPILESPFATGVMLVGLARPAVVFPHHLVSHLSRREMRMILSHELMHLRRWDPWLGLGPALTARLFFFHPLARLCRDRWLAASEAACDEGAIRASGAAPREYGELLVQLVRMNRPTAYPSLGIAGSQHSLPGRLRILRELASKGMLPPRRRPLTICQGALLVAAAVIALPWSAAHARFVNTHSAPHPGVRQMAPDAIRPTAVLRARRSLLVFAPAPTPAVTAPVKALAVHGAVRTPPEGEVRMKAVPWVRSAAVTAMLALAPPILARAGSPPPAVPGAADTVGESPQQVAKILHFMQANALHLSAAQVRLLVQKLTPLLRLDAAYRQRYARAALPVGPAIQRIEEAMLSGKAASPADQAAVHHALDPLQEQARSLANLSHATASAIREELTLAQLQVILTDLGLDPAAGDLVTGLAPGSSGPASDSPPAGSPLSGQPARSSASGAAPGSRATAGGSADSAPVALDMARNIGRKLSNHWHSMSQQEFDEVQRSLQSGQQPMVINLAQGIRLDLGDPAVWNDPQGILGIMERLRAMPDDQFQQSQDQVSAAIGQQIVAYMQTHPQGNMPPEGNPAAGMKGGDSTGPEAIDSARKQIEEDAVRRFFFRPDMLTFLRSKARG